MKLSYYKGYLIRFLKDINSPLMKNMDFINERTDAAAENYERFRREGYGVIEAEELTISILTKGIENNNETF